MTFNKFIQLNLINNQINKWSKKWLYFTFFLSLLIFDRIITLIYFGFIYTDIDQLILWNGAYDYSKGIFKEPFFYGQAYNYMLESLLAVPLLWVGIPTYIALPIVTSCISIIPFVILALIFKKKEENFWAFLSLAIPVLLPLGYNFLTTIPRGFVQAHLFVPILFVPLFNPKSKKNVTILCIISAICFVANQSSIILVLPFFLFVYLYHFKSPTFYLKLLLTIPIFIIDYLAKYYYKIYPEKILQVIVGIRLDWQTFKNSFKHFNHFENLFPFFSSWGILYILLFIFLAIITRVNSMKKEFLFLLIILFFLLITFAIPKVQENYPNAGIFYSSSRLYLLLPILLIITSYLVFNKLKIRILYVNCLLIISSISFITKSSNIQNTVEKTITDSSFPVANNKDLITRAFELNKIALKYNIDLIVHANFIGWDYTFDSYAFNTLARNNKPNYKKIISVNLNGDRRTWLYSNGIICKQILINGIKIDKLLLEKFDYEIINPKQIIIKNNTINNYKLFAKLNLKSGFAEF